MSSRHVLEARLTTRPRPTATSIAWDLWWELSVDDGVHGAGPAGTASFTVPDGGTTVWSDYSNPKRLLCLEIPAGQVKRIGTADELLAAASLGDADRALIHRLLGVGALERLAATDEIEFTLRVDEQSSWELAGRLSLAHQLLADRNEPVAGLWALEVVDLLARLDGGVALDLYRRELLVRAMSATALLPKSLLDAALSTSPPLGHLLIVSANRERRSLGPLADALQSRNVEAVLGELADVVDRAEIDFGEPEPSAPFRGGPSTSAQPVRVHLDHTLGGWVSEGTGAVADGRLSVQLGLAQHLQEPPQALRRIDVLVTSDGSLVAASVSVEPRPGGLTATLRLPQAAANSPLDVVVGRNLPQEPMDVHAFAERAATHAGRRLADCLRCSSIARSATVAEIRETKGSMAHLVRSNASTAALQWQRAGRPDLVREVESLTAARPFAVEQTAVALDIGTDLPELDRLTDNVDEVTARTLAAARDLAWSLGDLERAARIETVRLSRTGRHELPPAAHDALTLALLATSPTRALELDLELPA